ncbi:hypothetical protein RRG08_033763 [Elysia crispata]|uniref:Uncharacterized protein n=1 Tax=Elysia crispata TaxID=231223 RepID=A0AAE1AU83_9GAST|nr:hypothetical protein RRG08_033763 [Elysia crispata]
MQSADKLLFALHEIFQVALYAESSQIPLEEMRNPSIKVTMKQAYQKERPDDVCENIFNIKVSYNQRVHLLKTLQGEMPILYSFIREMQEREEESHLAVQTSVNEDNDRKKTTHILWVEETKTNGSSVKVTNEVVKPLKEDEDCGTVIQIRAFIGSMTELKACKEICSLIEAVKFLNPKMQLSFTYNSGNTIELDLRENKSFDSDVILIDPKLFERKYAHHYEFGVYEVQSSEVHTLADAGQSQLHSQRLFFTLKCVLLYIPLLKIYQLNGDENFVPRNGKETKTPGHIYLLFYGPHGVPLSISIFAKKLMEQPESFLHLSNFGIELCKRPAKCSNYSIQVCAQKVNLCGLSSKKSPCQRFCMVFAFILDHANIAFCNTESLSVHRFISENLLSIINFSILEKCTDSALSKIFGSTLALIQKGKALSDSASFERLIPDVVNSLTDIFTRSTNLDFRAQVSSLIPTASRAIMSQHLEKALKKVIHGSSISDHCEVILHSSDCAEEDFDDWDDSQINTLHTQSFEPSLLDLQDPSADVNTGAFALNLIPQSFRQECDEIEDVPLENEEDNYMERFFREDIIKAEKDLQLWELHGRLQENNRNNNIVIQDTNIHNEYVDDDFSIIEWNLSSQSNRNSSCQAGIHDEHQRHDTKGNLNGYYQFTDLPSLNQESFNQELPQVFKGFAHSPPNDLSFSDKSIDKCIQSPLRESFEYVNFQNNALFDHVHSDEILKQGSFPRKRSSEFSDLRGDMLPLQVPCKQSKVKHLDQSSAKSNSHSQSFNLTEFSNCSVDTHCVRMKPGMAEGESSLTISANIKEMLNPLGKADNDDIEWFDEEEIASWKAEMES